MNITLEEQIEYIKNTLSMFSKSAVLGFSDRDKVRDTCKAILATLESCRDEKTACKPMSDPPK